METAKAKKQRLIRLIHVGKTQLMMAERVPYAIGQYFARENEQH